DSPSYCWANYGAVYTTRTRNARHSLLRNGFRKRCVGSQLSVVRCNTEQLLNAERGRHETRELSCLASHVSYLASNHSRAAKIAQCQPQAFIYRGRCVGG